MQGAEAWLEVRQERRLDFLAWGHVGNIAARRHGWCGIPRQWGAGVTRDGAGRPTQARLAVADAAPVEAGALPVELLCGLVMQSRGARRRQGLGHSLLQG